MKRIKTIIATLIAGIFFGFLFPGCGGGEQEKTSDESMDAATPAEEQPLDPMENKGIGPVSHVELGDYEPALAANGEEIFTSKCSACHKMGKRFVGPDLIGVTERRTPEWIMNMMMNPGEMLQSDPIARELLAEFMTQMASQNLSQEEARALLEYFRGVDNNQIAVE